VSEHVDTVSAAAGLWATAADLVRFGRGWSSLLPAGRGRDGSASLVLHLDSGQVYVAMTNRSIPIEPVNGRVIGAARRG
jgi:hypothetical protein